MSMNCECHKVSFLKGWAQRLWGVLRVLNKIPHEWSCPCGGFPAISQGQMMGWTWPWKTKALHMQWVALLALWGQGLQDEFHMIPGAEFCCVWEWNCLEQFVVATAVARCKPKGQCYLPREYLRRWTEHKMWGERPWRGGVWGESKLAKMACSGCLVPHFINNDYVTAEIFIAVHMRILRYSLGHGLCEVHIYMSSCIMAMSVGLVMRGENTARILLWLVRQPGERLCAFMLYYVCCYSCRASQKKIDLPAVPMALCVFFRPLSLCLAYPGFSQEDSVNSKIIMNRMKSNTAFFSLSVFLVCTLPSFQISSQLSWNQPWQATAALV